MSAYETGRQVGYVAFPVVLLAVTAYVGWRMGQKRQPQKYVWWPVAVAAALLVLGVVGLQMKKQREAVYYTSEAR